MNASVRFTNGDRNRAGWRWLALGLAAAGVAVGASMSAEERGGAFSQLVENLDLSVNLQPQYDSLRSVVEVGGEKTTLESDELFFRRAFLGLKTRFGEKTRVEYLTDVSDHWAVNQIVRLEWKASEAQSFRMGYEKVPFGWEDTTSSSKVKPIERSASTRFWNEVVGLGSYHSGLQWLSRWKNGYESAFAFTNQQAADSAWPDVARDDLGLFARVGKTGSNRLGHDYRVGMDLGRSGTSREEDVAGVSAYGSVRVAGTEYSFEAITGRVKPVNSETARPFSWHVQVSRFIGKRFELVGRYSQIDSDGYGVKLSSLVREAPYSGFKYQDVDSVYAGINYVVDAKRLQLSAGYELGHGRSATNTTATDSERVDGFRLKALVRF